MLPYDFIRSRGTEAMSPGKQKRVTAGPYWSLMHTVFSLVELNKLRPTCVGAREQVLLLGAGKMGWGVPALWSQVTRINSDQHPHINLILSELQDPLINEPPPVTRSWIINKTWRWGLKSFIKEEKQLKRAGKEERGVQGGRPEYCVHTKTSIYTCTSRQIYLNWAGRTKLITEVDLLLAADKASRILTQGDNKHTTLICDENTGSEPVSHSCSTGSC